MAIVSSASSGGAALDGTNEWTAAQTFSDFVVKHEFGIISDSTGNGATVGNARGTGANDLTTRRLNATSVASGDYATTSGFDTTGSGNYSVALGQSALASGLNAAAIGNTTEATGSNSMAVCRESKASRWGQFSVAGGTFSGAGDAQTSILVARKQTTDATPTELALDGGIAYLTVESDNAYLVEISAIGRKTTANTNGAYTWTGVIVNDAGTTALLGSPAVTVVHEDDATWDFAVTADDTNDRLAMTVTGVAGTTINWVATIRMTEVKA